MTALLVFVSTFVAVFALGFQSRNVNQGHYTAAALTSFLIGAGNLALYRFMPTPGTWEVAAYLLAGPTAILASMKVHELTLSRKVTGDGMVQPTRPWPRPQPVDEHAAQHFPPCFECGLRAGQPCPRLVCERFTEPTRH